MKIFTAVLFLMGVASGGEVGWGQTLPADQTWSCIANCVTYAQSNTLVQTTNEIYSNGETITEAWKNLKAACVAQMQLAKVDVNDLVFDGDGDTQVSPFNSCANNYNGNR